MLFALLPLLIVSTITVTLTARNTRRQAEDTLTAIATLKEKQVDTWALDLQRNLSAEYDRVSETRRLITLLRLAPEDPAQTDALFSQFAATQQDDFRRAIASRGVFEEILVLNQDGDVIISTNDQQVGQNYGDQVFFVDGMKSPTLQSPANEPTLGHTTLVVSQPVVSEDGTSLGVLAGRVNLNQLNEIMLERTGLGQTGETYLVDQNLGLLTRSRHPNYPSASTGSSGARIDTFGARQAVEQQQGGISVYQNYQGESSLGAYRWLPSLQIGLLAEQAEAEALATNRTITAIWLLAATLAGLVAILAAVAVSAGLTRPITTLTSLAETAAAAMDRSAVTADSLGEDIDLAPLHNASAALESQTARQDEYGSLASAFYRMVAVLRHLLGNLEERVEQRTNEIQSRSEQILAAAEIGRSAAAILDTQILMQRVVDLLQERFDLYYVGLFLVDENRQNAVLSAATGRAGAAMIARRHQLPISAAPLSAGRPAESRHQEPEATSMIGWAIANDQARIALQAAEDEVRLVNPELPETRSEVAIPLHARQEVLGALSIQSRLPDAFDNDTVTIFQTVAAQVAVAIENARLFAASQQALESIQQAYGEINRRAWIERLASQPVTLHRDSTGLVKAASKDGGAAEIHPADSLALPLLARGQVIGVLRATAPANQTGGWTQEKRALLTTLTEQLSVAIDSARLFESTQQQAARERMVAEISSRMRATLDIDAILQTIATELCTALDLAEVEIRLGAPVQTADVELKSARLPPHPTGREPGSFMNNIKGFFSSDGFTPGAGAGYEADFEALETARVGRLLSTALWASLVVTTFGGIGLIWALRDLVISSVVLALVVIEIICLVLLKEGKYASRASSLSPPPGSHSPCRSSCWVASARPWSFSLFSAWCFPD